VRGVPPTTVENRYMIVAPGCSKSPQVAKPIHAEARDEMLR